MDERLEKITNLDEKVNPNVLIYRYQGGSSNENFNRFDNALDIINKIRDEKKDLADVKRNQQEFKLYLGEIKKGNKK